ncbi:AzlC family ABC transporter permease [Oceanimonas sp. MB9]|uniref:AzlC family ABC transporter permease n=1 Tax=Oceanimonas sp. MB9 TaxID=2588453 RepID=UPI0013F5F5B0|nr:AzlC family ABC transporter permease [Oceanimonas sp. MB9]NHI01711.1 Inner membrane protein YgaZ [Oceanimonas sp. MB9]
MASTGPESPGNRFYFFAGIKELLPMVPGVLPFGLIAGANGTSLGFSPELTLGMTLLFFAGSAQLAAYQLIQDQALPAIIVFTALMVNIRFLIYSAAFAPLLHDMKTRHKWPLAYLLSDQAYGLCASRFSPQDNGREKLYYYIGAALALWVSWVGSVGLGLLVGEQIPAEWSLEFAIPLAFLAMLVANIRDRAALITAICSAMLAIGLSRLPYNLGFIAAIIGGTALGLMAGNLFVRKRSAFDE